MKKITEIRIIHQLDEIPETSYLDSKYDGDTQTIVSSCQYTNDTIKQYGFERVKEWIDEDHKRLLNYGNTWWCIGIQAVAKIHILDNPMAGHHIVIPVTTPGLWGIESDSDKSYLDDVGNSELITLKEILMELGFTEDEFDKAVKESDPISIPIDM